jgi:SAM-dependent methyltransferase
MTHLAAKLAKAARNLGWRLVPGCLLRRIFRDSASYWQNRYEKGGSSGPGSSGQLAAFKAEVLNDFVARQGVVSVLEFGCGDGRQLALAKYPRYTGIDISPRALALCRERFAADKTKDFRLLADVGEARAQMTISLDVIYHLVEDSVFEAHMAALFDRADRYVALYSSDTDENRDIQGPHIRHRRFSAWIAANRPGWVLATRIKNRLPYEGDSIGASFADFFFYAKTAPGHAEAETAAAVPAIHP